jgi:glyoxalase family protein
MEIRGVHSVTLTVHEAPRSIAFLRDVLGWRVIGQLGNRVRLGIGTGGPGKTIDILHAPEAPPCDERPRHRAPRRYGHRDP